MNSVMNLNDVNVWVRLGCSSEEQSFIQQVRFDIEIIFSNKVEAETSDTLSDSIDYVQISKIIQSTATEKNYAMIEHLCFSVLKAIQLGLLKNSKGHLKVSCLKLRPPVSHVHGGVSWTCLTAL